MSGSFAMLLGAILYGCAGSDPPAHETADAAACGLDSGGAPTWEGWGHDFFTTWCQSCHASDSPQRYGAPESIVFDDEEDVRAMAGLVRSAVIETGRMPIGGGLDEEDLALLDAFLCTLESR